MAIKIYFVSFKMQSKKKYGELYYIFLYHLLRYIR